MQTVPALSKTSGRRWKVSDKLSLCLRQVQCDKFTTFITVLSFKPARFCHIITSQIRFSTFAKAVTAVWEPVLQCDIIHYRNRHEYCPCNYAKDGQCRLQTAKMDIITVDTTKVYHKAMRPYDLPHNMLQCLMLLSHPYRCIQLFI